MGNHSWQKGTIRIPTQEWTGLKESVLQSAIIHRNNVMNGLSRIVNALNTMPEDFKATSLEFSLTKISEHFFPGRSTFYYNALVLQALSALRHPAQAGKFNQPTEALIDSLFGPKPSIETSVYGHSFFCEWSLTFDSETKTLTWDVPENNEAVSRAHVEPFVEAFFDALESIPFCNYKDVGGVIVGNDENNQNSTALGGGANYICARFRHADDGE